MCVQGRSFEIKSCAKEEVGNVYAAGRNTRVGCCGFRLTQGCERDSTHCVLDQWQLCCLPREECSKSSKFRTDIEDL